MREKALFIGFMVLLSYVMTFIVKADCVPDAVVGKAYEIIEEPQEAFPEIKIESETKASEEIVTSNLETKQLRSMGTFNVTAYCSCRKCCGKWSPEVTGEASWTASGTHPKAGRTVATDPDVIPLGTKIIIDGHEYIAEDTGSGVNGNHIDIYFDSHRDARNFGLQKKEVFMYQN